MAIKELTPPAVARIAKRVQRYNERLTALEEWRAKQPGYAAMMFRDVPMTVMASIDHLELELGRAEAAQKVGLTAVDSHLLQVTEIKARELRVSLEDWQEHADPATAEAIEGVIEALDSYGS